MAATILDTEVTGLEDIEVIELACIEYETPQDMMDSNEMRRVDQRFKPVGPITTGAMAVHHIMDEDLVECQPFTDCVIPDGIVCIVGHNVDFDWKALGSPDVKRICTLALSRWLWPEANSHKLGAMVYQLNRSEARRMTKDAHNAMADVLLCREVLSAAIMKMGEMELIDPETVTFQALWKLSEAARIPKVITFGKHKGMAINDLPCDYVNWLLKQADLDEYLRLALTSR